MNLYFISVYTDDPSPYNYSGMWVIADYTSAEAIERLKNHPKLTSILNGFEHGEVQFEVETEGDFRSEIFEIFSDYPGIGEVI